VKNDQNRCSFAEVIAKINRVSAFLDHPVYADRLIRGNIC